MQENSQNSAGTSSQKARENMGENKLAPKKPNENSNESQALESKQRQIVNMFDEIAKDYDKANRILSLGIDISWRVDATKRALNALESTSALSVLDVACGSGDMILHWQKRLRALNGAQNAYQKIIGIDPSKEMLKAAHQKIPESKLINVAANAGEVDSGGDSAKADSGANETESNSADSSASTSPNTAPISLMLGEAKDLSAIESSSIDIVSIAYGLRNVLSYELALSEFARVLKKGGVLVVLDFFKKPKPSLLDKIIGLYTKRVLPIVGGLISRNFAAYKYLPDSMEVFVTPEELKAALEKVGIQTKEIRSYSAGISHLVLGVKI